MRCTPLLTAGLLLSTAVPVFAHSVVHTRPSHPRTATHATVKHLATTKGTKKSGHAALAAATVHATPARREATTGIAPDRATEIQTALIKQGYLTGEPTGTWDAATVAAMEKLQGENGWQTRITPDSRALIKLGLGGPPQTAATPQQ